jgi:hypothetical protein
LLGYLNQLSEILIISLGSYIAHSSNLIDDDVNDSENGSASNDLRRSANMLNKLKTKRGSDINAAMLTGINFRESTGAALRYQSIESEPEVMSTSPSPDKLSFE